MVYTQMTSSWGFAFTSPTAKVGPSGNIYQTSSCRWQCLCAGSCGFCFSLASSARGDSCGDAQAGNASLQHMRPWAEQHGWKTTWWFQFKAVFEAAGTEKAEFRVPHGGIRQQGLCLVAPSVDSGWDVSAGSMLWGHCRRDHKVLSLFHS